jgi:hypothetical protein
MQPSATLLVLRATRIVHGIVPARTVARRPEDFSDSPYCVGSAGGLRRARTPRCAPRAQPRLFVHSLIPARPPQFTHGEPEAFRLRVMRAKTLALLEFFYRTIQRRRQGFMSHDPIKKRNWIVVFRPCFSVSDLGHDLCEPPSVLGSCLVGGDHGSARQAAARWLPPLHAPVSAIPRSGDRSIFSVERIAAPPGFRLSGGAAPAQPAASTKWQAVK